MTLDATAQALVADQAAPDTPESEDDALSAAFDSITADDPVDEEDTPQDEAPDSAEDETAGADDAEAESGETTDVEPVVEAPTDLPSGVKAAWSDIPEGAREAIQRSHREMSAKLADQGRQIQGLAPITDVLSRAAQDLPGILDMTPDQVASEVFALAKISSDFNTNPHQAMMGLIDRHGLKDDLRRMLGGEQPGELGSAQREIKELKQQLARVSDPNAMRQNFDQWSAEERAVNEVQQFATQAEHWSEVEPHIPQFIPIVQQKLGGGASEKDILQAAYTMAINALMPETKAKDMKAADEAAANPDPRRTEAAKKAKSVNVAGKSSGKTRELSEDERLGQIYDRAVKS